MDATVDASEHCVLDDECVSRVCLTEGRCAAPDTVFYVSPVGIAAGKCSSTTPCEINYAKSQVTPDHIAMRLEDGTYRLDLGLVVDAATPTLIVAGGRNAELLRTAAGPVVEVRDGSSLELHGMTFNKGISCTNFSQISVSRVAFGNSSNEILPWIDLKTCVSAKITNSELSDSTADGINAESSDIVVSQTKIVRSAGNGLIGTGSHLTISDSTIDSNGALGIDASFRMLDIHRSTISFNHAGGIRGTGGNYNISNNFIFRNGNDTDSTFGGLNIQTTSTGNRIIHNTITRNDSDPLANPLRAGGFFCMGATGSFFNNLIVNNFAGSATQPNAQTGGTCDLTGSQIINDDLMSRFASANSPPYNYHLGSSASSAVNAGVNGPDPETQDFDGEPRNDGAPDVGADELKP
ncbi:MAG TPA: right-handed parallel beta-helix repeat-containing protein [Kofleriaceae bacterium]|nr:right-handed parallel beta-helix repeat-containing protein [Kofleriaceae bacterium]